MFQCCFVQPFFKLCVFQDWCPCPHVWNWVCRVITSSTVGSLFVPRPAVYGTALQNGVELMVLTFVRRDPKRACGYKRVWELSHTRRDLVLKDWSHKVSNRLRGLLCVCIIGEMKTERVGNHHFKYIVQLLFDIFEMCSCCWGDEMMSVLI